MCSVLFFHHQFVFTKFGSYEITTEWINLLEVNF